jgi:hypothetical protein
MSASAFFTLVADPVPTGDSAPGLNAAARSLEMRKTTGGGPTSALGASSGTAAYADQMRVTAVDGMIMAPLYVTSLPTSAPATTLQISKSGATYFLACGTNNAALSLELPPLSGIVGGIAAAAVAGFKARFVATATLASSNIKIIAAAATTQTSVFRGRITNMGSVAPSGSTTTASLLVASGGAVTSANGTGATITHVINKSCIALSGAGTVGIQFVAGSVAAGDWVEFETDGFAWYVRGEVAAYSAVTEI